MTGSSAHGLSLSSTTSVQLAAGTSLPQGSAETSTDRTFVPSRSPLSRARRRRDRRVPRDAPDGGPPRQLHHDRSRRRPGDARPGRRRSIHRDRPCPGASVIAEPSELRAAGTSTRPRWPAVHRPGGRDLRPQPSGLAGRDRPDVILGGALRPCRATRQVLRSARYTYDVDVRDIDCGTMSAAECFAATRRGYCIHYSMTMAVILRNLGVPARVVEGFLPGERSPGSVDRGHSQLERPRLGRGLLSRASAGSPSIRRRPVDCPRSRRGRSAPSRSARSGCAC